MVDTERTVTELITLFANNASGDISEQDIRDFVVSMQPASGSLYISTPIQTVITTQSVATKVLGTATAGVALHNMTVTDNRLTYTGTIARMFIVEAAITLEAASNNQSISMYVAKNGTVVTSSHQRRFISTGADEGNMAVFAEVELVTNDYIEVWAVNNTGTANLTVNLMNFAAQGIIE